MTIELKPEQEQIIRQEIESGNFRSATEVLDHALAALREKARRPKSLVQFFRESPLVGMEIKFERSSDTGRKIDLGADSCSRRIPFLNWLASSPHGASWIGSTRRMRICSI